MTATDLTERKGNGTIAMDGKEMILKRGALFITATVLPKKNEIRIMKIGDLDQQATITNEDTTLTIESEEIPLPSTMTKADVNTTTTKADAVGIMKDGDNLQASTTTKNGDIHNHADTPRRHTTTTRRPDGGSKTDSYAIEKKQQLTTRIKTEKRQWNGNISIL